MKLNEILKLVLSIVVCQLVGFIGSFFTTPAIPTWYATLNKPSFTPPNWVFGPVWTLLYLMMAVSAWLVWSDPGLPRARIPLILFIVQLALNAAWSCLFFFKPV